MSPAQRRRLSAWSRAGEPSLATMNSAVGGDEIHVAQGAYNTDRDEAHPLGTGDRTSTFQLITGVELLGGYAGLGAEDPDARDIVAHVTILTGDLLGNDMGSFVNYDENSYHVVTGSETVATALLEGFTITAGYANGPGWPSLDQAGAGMLNVAGSPTVRQCRFEKNWAAAYGGGMENLSDSGPRVELCAFVGNPVFPGDADGSATGGGMDNYQNVAASPVVIDCQFEDNKVTRSGEGVARGGGLYVSEGAITVTDTPGRAVASDARRRRGR